jgi:transcriptional regulator with XRE-family HTH domain
MPHKPEDKDAAETLRSALGLRIRAGRDALGWTQERLAAAIGVGAEMLRRYERGAKFPSHLTLIRLAEVLGSSLDHLLGHRPDEATTAPSAEELVRAWRRLDVKQRRAIALLVFELAATRAAGRTG